MKKLIFTFALIASVIMASSQTLKHTDMQNITSKSDDYSEYVASDGYTYRVGERVKFGQPANNKTFMYIQEGDGWITPVQNAPASVSGNEVEIKSISIGGTKRTGFYVSFRTKGIIGLLNCSVRFEEALSCGEVIGYGKTSNQALTELKNAKEKLDLELITRQQFDSIKAELSKYIK